MKDNKIRYLKGNKELLRLADEDYEDMLFFQPAVGFSGIVPFLVEIEQCLTPL